MNQEARYTTIASTGTALFRDRGSKFLAYAYPVRNQAEVKSYLQLLKKEHPKAVHHCYAFRLGTEGLQFRAADDGEPAGSAGRPILGQIDSAGLTNVLVVVVRYFGGTLLGVPGLINAYKTVAAESLATSGRQEQWLEEITEISCDYNNIGEVLYLLKQHEATIYNQEQQLFCTISAGIPLPYKDTCRERLLQLRGVTVKGSA